MTRWGVTIDLRKCIGCETCQHVCYDINYVPPGAAWRRIMCRELADNQKKQVFLIMSCMHCADPPCLRVCPTGATYQRSDGIVEIKNELCIGCGACILACPYSARSISFEDKVPINEGGQFKYEVMMNHNRIGTCTKCNFCRQHLDTCMKKGLQPGVDPEADPICVRFCIAGALHFGDLDDPESVVSKLIKENKTIRLKEELETKPSIYYLVE